MENAINLAVGSLTICIGVLLWVASPYEGFLIPAAPQEICFSGTRVPCAPNFVNIMLPLIPLIFVLVGAMTILIKRRNRRAVLFALSMGLVLTWATSFYRRDPTGFEFGWPEVWLMNSFSAPANWIPRPPYWGPISVIIPSFLIDWGFWFACFLFLLFLFRSTVSPLIRKRMGMLPPPLWVNLVHPGFGVYAEQYQAVLENRFVQVFCMS